MKLVLLKEDQMVISKKAYDTAHAVHDEMFEVWYEDLSYILHELAEKLNHTDVGYDLFKKTEAIEHRIMDMRGRLGVYFLYERLE